MPLPVVTPMTVDDLDAIMALERVCFKDPWTCRMYLADLTQNELATYSAVRLPHSDSNHSSLATHQTSNVKRQTSLLAYGGFWLMADEAHIATIASHPDWRGCGLGALSDAGAARCCAGERRASLDA